MTTWNSPDFTEIKMDAEIGSYQEGNEPRDPRFARPPQPLAATGASQQADD